MSFVEAVRSVLGRYTGFSGRARRSEYWWFYLFAAVVFTIAYAIAVGVLAAGAVSDPTSAGQGPGAAVAGGLVLLVALALFLPSLAVSVRRLHDTGRSGWWYLVNAVPLVGPIVLIVFLVADSEPGANRYGPSPKGGAGPHGTGVHGTGVHGSPDGHASALG